ncbi:MAG: hemerythrin domain-containing protein [Acidobacteria bacterium]|nr:hemerythrin domain-containing protein [Acidobacteriota bacterium]
MSAEHRMIEHVVNALSEAVDQQRRLDVDTLHSVVEFLGTYADRRHHEREEALFFPLLVRRGVPPQGCPIGGLNNDHAKGRALVATLADQIPAYAQQHPDAERALRQTLGDIARLYRHHLWMEDAMVFPMAERLVSEDDHQELLAKFIDLDRVIGPAVVARLERFADTISFPAGGTGTAG